MFHIFLHISAKRHASDLHRPLKQLCIVLWNDTLLKVNTRESHRKSIRAKKFALEEYFCSFVVHLLVLFHFWHLTMLTPACVVIINFLCTVQRHLEMEGVV